MVRDIKWQSHRWVSRLVRALVFVIPLIVGVIAATFIARIIPGYDSFIGGVAWWLVVLGTSFVAVDLADRLARKFLPLAALLDMSLVFPGTAPSRVKVAMRTWTTAQLQARIHEARDLGIDDDPTRAGETVLLLVAALNAHDHVTRGHAERTRAFTDVLAEELGVPIDEREKLRWVALLHDVGKLKIAESVLNKPGKLDEGEWEVIKRHPELGDELVAPIKGFLAPWADTVLHHHERWDGTGYPQGLAGEQINYGARIVAVADAYDAMTARRSYQPAKNSREALRELSTSAGTQFDPTVVRAFLDISAGRLRRLTGPLTVLAQIPFIAGFQRVAEWAGTAAAGTAVVVAAVATGVVAPVVSGPGFDSPIAAPTTTVAPNVEIAAVTPGTTTSASSSTATTAVDVSNTTTSVPEVTSTTETPGVSTTIPSTTTSTSAPATTTTVPGTTTTAAPGSTTTTTTGAPGTTTTTTAAPANSPPIATNDNVDTNPNAAVNVDVLINDSDPDGDPFSLTSCSTSTQGAVVTVNGDRCKYSKHPDPDNWTVPDTFTYTIKDSNGATATATVTVCPQR